MITTWSQEIPPRSATNFLRVSRVSLPSPIVADVAAIRTSSDLTPNACLTLRRSNAISAA